MTRIRDFFQVQLFSPSTIWGEISLLIPLESVGELITVVRGNICPIPGVHSEILGVTNQRGKLLWVIDVSLNKLVSNSGKVRSLNGSYISVPNRKQKLTTILLHQDQKQLGYVVFGLMGIVHIDEQNFHPLTAELSEGFPYCEQQVLIDQQVAVILRVDWLFNTLQSFQFIYA